MDLKKLCVSVGEAYERGLLGGGILLVSYPASGELLLRKIVAELLYYPEEITITNVGFFVPSTDELSFEEIVKVLERRRFKIVHTYLWYFPFRGKVVYLVERPERVLKNLRAFTGEAEDLIFGSLGFPAWDEHVGSWLGAMEGKETFLLVKAEDLHKVETIEKVARFIGGSSLPQREERVYRAVQMAGTPEEGELSHSPDLREVFGKWMKRLGWL